jgi:thioredoxin reductase (NADPH)
LIKNSVEQGQQAIENIVKLKKLSKKDVVDVIIIGAGPAGISATLAAKKHELSSVTLEQDSLGGTVFTFPRSKLVMTSPMKQPLYGKVKLYDTSKDELLQLWNKVIKDHDLKIIENTKVETITPLQDGSYKVITNTGKELVSNYILLATGRRGSPRKLNVPGEEAQKVAYRLLEPERITGKKIIVVGGGDSAVESAMLLMDNNEVILSYRKDKFARIKPKNKESIIEAVTNNSIEVIFNSNLESISDSSIMIKVDEEENSRNIENDLVYIFAGGELPTSFLQKAGVKITKRFGHIVKTY